MLEDLRCDLARYVPRGEPLWRQALVLAETQGLWAVAVYRYGRWVYTRAPAAARPLLKGSYRLLHKLVEITTGIKIPASCEIGAGLYVGHFGTIILHSDVKLGRGCSLSQDTTIGTRALGSTGVPVIGDGVYLGAGCRVLGPIRVGDGAAIGANAVVLHDVPAGATAVGVPARVVEGRVEAAAPDPALTSIVSPPPVGPAPVWGARELQARSSSAGGPHRR